MITFITLLILALIIKLTLNILPAIIGLSFTIFLTVLQVVGFLLLVPMIGVLFVFIDLLFIWIVVAYLKL